MHSGFTYFVKNQALNPEMMHSSGPVQTLYGYFSPSCIN
ncbi:hypothetical protein DSOL_1675 [Desulfosporosinus metallidurans]|uniref:Uncharacterized protein n=1 Tax=Desulfosporosinus metallidurans TaxID=1888891 RepID=A0A1Q8QYH2_9FIRM|nr:hypothetical protein DSOL_1675 [Desulfosporosinus metallidurans]